MFFYLKNSSQPLIFTRLCELGKYNNSCLLQGRNRVAFSKSRRGWVFFFFFPILVPVEQSWALQDPLPSTQSDTNFRCPERPSRRAREAGSKRKVSVTPGPAPGGGVVWMGSEGKERGGPFIWLLRIWNLRTPSGLLAPGVCAPGDPARLSLCPG